MPRTALEDLSYEAIKSHILAPEQSTLNDEQRAMFDRITSVAKILDKNPVQKHAIALHMAKFPDIGRTQAHKDVRMAARLFNTMHSFDYDFWQTWLINDIVKNIERARQNIVSKSEKQTAAILRVIAMEHANLVRAIGERNPVPTDPRLTEKHEFYILIQQNNQEIKIDFNKLKDLPASTLQELNRALFSGNEITDVEAEEIMAT